MNLFTKAVEATMDERERNSSEATGHFSKEMQRKGEFLDAIKQIQRSDLYQDVIEGLSELRSHSKRGIFGPKFEFHEATFDGETIIQSSYNSWRKPLVKITTNLDAIIRGKKQGNKIHIDFEQGYGWTNMKYSPGDTGAPHADVYGIYRNDNRTVFLNEKDGALKILQQVVRAAIEQKVLDPNFVAGSRDFETRTGGREETVSSGRIVTGAQDTSRPELPLASTLSLPACAPQAGVSPSAQLHGGLTRPKRLGSSEPH